MSLTWLTADEAVVETRQQCLASFRLCKGQQSSTSPMPVDVKQFRPM